MKKLFKTAFFVALGATMMLQSCGDEETVAPDRSGSATISGVVTGNVNRLGQNGTDLEPVSGATVKVTYTNQNLSYSGVNGNDVYTIIKTATTNSSGEYSVSVDATNEGNIVYTVAIEDFITEVSDSVLANPRSNPNPTGTTTNTALTAGTEKYRFNDSETVTGLTSGETEYIQLDLGNGTKIEDFIEQ